MTPPSAARPDDEDRRDRSEPTPRQRTASDAAAVLTASRGLLGVVARSLAPALEQVSLPQFRALVVLSSHGEPMRSGALATALGVHPSTFSRNADRLEAGGWVRRVENPDSRREVLVELTPEGTHLVDLVTRRRRTEIAAVLRRLDDDERRLVVDAFELFTRAAGEPTVEELAALGM